MFKPGQEEREDSQERTTFLSESQSQPEQTIESFELDQLKHDEKETNLSPLSSFFQRNLGNNPIAGDYLSVYRIKNDWCVDYGHIS